jgi:hypothetical protein
MALKSPSKVLYDTDMEQVGTVVPSNRALHEALYRVKQDIGAVNKNRKGYNYKYADLKDCHEALDPLLEREGLLWITSPRCCDGSAGIDYSVNHLESGGSITGSLMLPMADLDPQKAGSAITYSRRYALAIFGLLTEDDDDGKAATKKRKSTKQAKGSLPEFITMEQAQALVAKIRSKADELHPEDSDKADAAYMQYGKDLVAALKIERLGAMAPAQVAEAEAFIASLEKI